MTDKPVRIVDDVELATQVQKGQSGDAEEGLYLLPFTQLAPHKSAQKMMVEAGNTRRANTSPHTFVVGISTGWAHDKKVLPALFL